MNVGHLLKYGTMEPQSYDFWGIKANNKQINLYSQIENITTTCPPHIALVHPLYPSRNKFCFFCYVKPEKQKNWQGLGFGSIFVVGHRLNNYKLNNYKLNNLLLLSLCRGIIVQLQDF